MMTIEQLKKLIYTIEQKHRYADDYYFNIEMNNTKDLDENEVTDFNIHLYVFDEEKGKYIHTYEETFKTYKSSSEKAIYNTMLKCQSLPMELVKEVYFA